MQWAELERRVMAVCEAMGLLKAAGEGGKMIRGIWARTYHRTTVFVYYPPDTKLGDILQSNDTARLYLSFDPPLHPVPVVQVPVPVPVSPSTDLPPDIHIEVEIEGSEEEVEIEGADTLLSLGGFMSDVESSGASRMVRIEEPVGQQLQRSGAREGERNWTEFNSWYRRLLGSGSKPSAVDVARWCDENGQRIWSDNQPTKQKMRDHISGLRPLGQGPNSVSAHFKKMRSKKNVASQNK